MPGKIAKNARPISPEAFSPLQPSLPQKRERILLAGDSNTGKSFGWVQIAQTMFEEDADKDEKRKVIVVDTDGTTPTFLGPGEDFEYLYHANGGNVFPLQAQEFELSVRAVGYIMQQAKPNDWVAVDLVTRWNDQAQLHVAKEHGISLDDMWMKRAVNEEGFGAFNPGQWNQVKRAHDILLSRLDRNIHSNLLYLSHINEYADYHADRQVKATFDHLKMRPDARPSVYKAVNTVLILWTEVMTSGSGTNKRNIRNRLLHVLKDRGQPYEITEDYDRNFYTKLQEIRATHQQPKNPTPEMIAAARRQAQLEAADDSGGQ